MLVVGAPVCGGGEYMETSAHSAPFCWEPKTTLKKIKSVKKKNQWTDTYHRVFFLILFFLSRNFGRLAGTSLHKALRAWREAAERCTRALSPLPCEIHSLPDRGLAPRPHPAHSQRARQAPSASSPGLAWPWRPLQYLEGGSPCCAPSRPRRCDEGLSF